MLLNVITDRQISAMLDRTLGGNTFGMAAHGLKGMLSSAFTGVESAVVASVDYTAHAANHAGEAVAAFRSTHPVVAPAPKVATQSFTLGA